MKNKILARKQQNSFRISDRDFNLTFILNDTRIRNAIQKACSVDISVGFKQIEIKGNPANIKKAKRVIAKIKTPIQENEVCVAFIQRKIAFGIYVILPNMQEGFINNRHLKLKQTKYIYNYSISVMLTKDSKGDLVYKEV